MEVGKWKMAQTWRHFKRPASSKGLWKQFVDDSRERDQRAEVLTHDFDELTPREEQYYQKPPFSTNEVFLGSKGGQAGHSPLAISQPPSRRVRGGHPLRKVSYATTRSGRAEGGTPQLVQPGPGRPGYNGAERGSEAWKKNISESRKGQSSAVLRPVKGLQPHEVTVYRRLITERAAKRGIEAPNWDTHPGRGYSSDNLKGQSIAKDIKRRLVGSRKGSVIGVGSGTDVEGKILSKVDQDKIKKRFGSTYEGEWNFKTKKNPSGNTYGISGTTSGGKNEGLGNKIRNYIKGIHGPNYAFDNFDSANYHLTQMYRAANNKTNPNKNYRPIYSTKGIIGYKDLTEKGGGKEYYHADYTGVDSNGKEALKINKNHPDADNINKLIEIVEGTKQDRTVLDDLFKAHGYKTPSFERLLDSLMDTDGAQYIDSAIHKHHQYGVAREPGAIQLVTRDQNMFSKLIERRVDAGKMTTETADKLLKPMGVQIVRDGKKIGAPDIKPEKQIKDWKKWVQRKGLEAFATKGNLETPNGRLFLKQQNTARLIDRFLSDNNLDICKREFKTGKSVLCGADFAKAEPEEFIKEVRKRDDAVKLLTKGQKFKNALRGLSVWAKGELGPFGWIGSMATIDAGLTLAAKAEGKDWLEALDEGVLWFLPRSVLKSEERALMSRAGGLSDKEKESMRIYFKLEDVDKKWADNDMYLEHGEEEGPVTITTPWGDTLEEEGTGVSKQQSYETMREHLARANNKLITDLKRNEGTLDTDKVLQETYQNVWDTRGRRALDLINESKDTYLDILVAQSGKTGLGKTAQKDIFGDKAGVLTSAFSNPAAYLRATSTLPGLGMSREEKEKIATDAGREDLLYKEYMHPLYGPSLSFEQWQKAYPEEFGAYAQGGIVSLLKK